MCYCVVALNAKKTLVSVHFQRDRRFVNINFVADMGLEKLNMEGKNSNSETRKTKKPLIEKQRRKRINDSLHELKRLVLEALHRDITLYEKMEKADVLDMTVNYLKSTQCTKKQQENATDLAGYQTGYRECQEHITRVLITEPAINANKKSQIISHFAVARPATMTLNLRRPPHAFVSTSTYPIQPHFTTTPPSSPIPSPTTKHPVSPMEGLNLLSRTAELKPKRMSHSESLTRTDMVWRPWQAETSGK